MSVPKIPVSYIPKSVYLSITLLSVLSSPRPRSAAKASAPCTALQNEPVDSSEISYESSVEILDEETFKEEIEKNAQNGKEAIDTNEEDKNEKN